jgi:SAM-dependent methyltransferase
MSSQFTINSDLDYNTIDTLGAMEYAPNYHEWILDEFKPHIGKRVVEVGSGTGSITKKLFDYNLEKLIAIEPSKLVYNKLNEGILEYVNDTGKIETEFKSFNSYLTDSKEFLCEISVDTFIYINVLEHIEDDLAELKLMYSILEEGGKILIFVPALQWLFGSHDANVGHFRRYYKKELKNKVEKAGFKIEKINYFDFLGIIPWWIAFKLLKLKYLKDDQSKVYDKIIVPLERIVEQKLSPIVGKNLLLIAVK